jgi:hypothetical protein
MSRRAAANPMSAAAKRGPPEHTLGRCDSDALIVADEFGVTRPTIYRHLQTVYRLAGPQPSYLSLGATFLKDRGVKSSIGLLRGCTMRVLGRPGHRR